MSKKKGAAQILARGFLVAETIPGSNPASFRASWASSDLQPRRPHHEYHRNRTHHHACTQRMLRRPTQSGSPAGSIQSVFFCLSELEFKFGNQTHETSILGQINHGNAILHRMCCNGDFGSLRYLHRQRTFSLIQSRKEPREHIPSSNRPSFHCFSIPYPGR